MNVLEQIVARTRDDVVARRARTPVDQLPAPDGARREFAAAMAAPGLSLVAEHKRRSPSAGTIREDVTLEEVVQAYERAGAAAVSVLTDTPYFGGSLADLTAARAATRLPILRKDFVVDVYQLHEALAYGADAVLLIVAALSDGELRALHELAGELGLDALVEVHDEPEMRRAADAGARIVGINNRDLTTLEVDVGRTFELLPHAPDSALVVAESGLRTRAQLDQLAEAGLDAVLIGEALMRSPDIESAARQLTSSR